MEWKVITEYPSYEINSDGIVRNIETGKIKNKEANNVYRFHKPTSKSFSLPNLMSKYFPENIWKDNSGEQWKPVIGFDGLYEVSNLGRVRSLPITVMRTNGREYTKPAKVLKNRYRGKERRRYSTVALYNQARQINHSVHRLVATAFIANPENLPCIHHINNDPSDNRVANLEWVTVAGNNYHSRKLKGCTFKKKRIIVKNK